MLLGGNWVARPGARKLLFIKARVQEHIGEGSAPAQAPMVLGAVAREIGWDVRCLDTYLIEEDPEVCIRRALRDFPADVVGFTALTAECHTMQEFARVVRDARPEAVILAGGAHSSANPEGTAQDPSVDAAVIGEGEETLREILERIDAGQEWKDVPGMAVRGEDGEVRRTACRPNIQDLDQLPLPAWDLTDVEAYSHRRGMALAGNRRYMPITTSRGCPYRCTYCHDVQGKRFRSQSPEYVLRMIDDLRENHNVYDYDICDDIFNFDAERMMAILDGWIERGDVRFTLPNGVRADRMTREQVKRVADAGCEYVGVAIETISPRLQKRIRKHVRFDKLTPTMEAFTDNRVLTAGFFMLGFPTETEQEIRSTIDWALKSKLHAAYFFVVTPYGGTEMHAQVTDVFGQQATRLTGTGMFSRPQENLSEVPDAQFNRLRRMAYWRFYIDPRRIWRILRDHPRRTELFRYFAAMVRNDLLQVDLGKLWRPFARLRGRRIPAVES